MSTGMQRWRGWRAHLLNPLGDAVLGRYADSHQLQRHARGFPGSEADAAESATSAARLGYPVDAGWAERHMLTGALDRQDNFARMARRSLAGADRLEVKGQWPRGAFVALGMHWGTGFPVLEHLLKSGRQPAFVYRPERDEDLPSLPARIADRLHLRALRGFGHTIAVGGAYERILSELAAECVPVILFDAPVTSGASQIEVRRPGGRVNLRAGLPGLIAAHQIPYLFFRCSHRPGQRPRLLEIGELQHSAEPGRILEQAADFLLESLRVDAAQWRLWPVAGTLLGEAGRSSMDADAAVSPAQEAAP